MGANGTGGDGSYSYNITMGTPPAGYAWITRRSAGGADVARLEKITDSQTVSTITTVPPAVPSTNTAEAKQTAIINTYQPNIVSEEVLNGPMTIISSDTRVVTLQQLSIDASDLYESGDSDTVYYDGGWQNFMVDSGIFLVLPVFAGGWSTQVKVYNRSTQVLTNTITVPGLAFSSIYFVSGILHLVGLGHIHSSSDRGATWTERDLTATPLATSTLYVQDGFIAGIGNDGNMYRSTDWGATFTNIGAAPLATQYNAISYYDNAVYSASGSDNKLYKVTASTYARITVGAAPYQETVYSNNWPVQNSAVGYLATGFGSSFAWLYKPFIDNVPPGAQDAWGEVFSGTSGPAIPFSLPTCILCYRDATSGTKQSTDLTTWSTAWSSNAPTAGLVSATMTNGKIILQFSYVASNRYEVRDAATFNLEETFTLADGPNHMICLVPEA